MKKLIYVILIGGLITGCSRSQQADNVQSEITSSPVTPEKDFLNEGMEYLKQADLPSAIKSFDEAIRQNPTNPKGYIVLGETYMRMKDFDRAIDTFGAASMMAPNEGEIFYLLAVSHQLAGPRHVPEALQSAQRSLAAFKKKNDEKNYARSLALIQQIINEGKQLQEMTAQQEEQRVEKN